jgi:hypothetical protein
MYGGLSDRVYPPWGPQYEPSSTGTVLISPALPPNWHYEPRPAHFIIVFLVQRILNVNKPIVARIWHHDHNPKAKTASDFNRRGFGCSYVVLLYSPNLPTCRRWKNAQAFEDWQ